MLRARDPVGNNMNVEGESDNKDGSDKGGSGTSLVCFG